MAAIYQSDDPEFKTDYFVYFHYFDDRDIAAFDEVQNITGGVQQMQRPPCLNTSII